MKLTHGGVIPEILKDRLNDNQLQILENFLNSLPKDRREAEIEEDCTGGSSVYFKISASGIGDNIEVCHGRLSVWLDDGLDP